MRRQPEPEPLLTSRPACKFLTRELPGAGFELSPDEYPPHDNTRKDPALKRLWALVRQGRLPARAIGSRYYFAVRDLEQFAAEHTRIRRPRKPRQERVHA